MKIDLQTHILPHDRPMGILPVDPQAAKLNCAISSLITHHFF